jgi:FkbM family methyltransferase
MKDLAQESSDRFGIERKKRMGHLFRCISQTMGRLFAEFFIAASKLRTGKNFNSAFLSRLMQSTCLVVHNGHRIQLVVPNWLNRYRADTFATKEPETLEWIESLEPGTVLWDIGANVGLYSVYAAKHKECNVFAFEPSVFNLEALARNIFNNQLQALITVVPFALSDRAGANLFRLSSTEWGGALSTFQESFGQDGRDLAASFEYRICGVTMDSAATVLGIPIPHYIKMDVDGIEHFILAGGANVLIQIKGILIEINDTFSEQSKCAVQLLESAGLSLYKKCRVDGAEGQYNQWWVRNS